jgi:hypothetical protein
LIENPPRRTLAHLPEYGIVIFATVRPRPAFASSVPNTPRLSLARARVTSFAGLRRYAITAITSGYRVDVDVYFASPPTAPTLREAQAQLGRLAIPPISIDARPRVAPSVISPGFDGVTVLGSLASGQANERITIQSNECLFPGWRDVATTETEPGGVWHVKLVPQMKTTYRARWKTAVSAGVVVRTRPGVSLTKNGRTLWDVGVLAQRSFLDRIGRLQRYDRRTRSWRTVKKFRLTEKRSVPAGSWTYAHFRARVSRGTQVRAYIPRSQVKPCYLAGYSLILTT